MMFLKYVDLNKEINVIRLVLLERKNHFKTAQNVYLTIIQSTSTSYNAEMLYLIATITQI